VKILLDENTPVQVLPILRQVLPGHQIDHVTQLAWSSKKDKHLIPDAAKRGYGMIVTKDSDQLNDPDECRIIKRSKMHHVRYRQRNGLAALGRSVGAIVAAMHGVAGEADRASRQLLFRVHGIEGGPRHTSTDPIADLPKYWPS
jgi:predicted nuclease of predicted toxin-antitoxin system